MSSEIVAADVRVWCPGDAGAEDTEDHGVEPLPPVLHGHRPSVLHLLLHVSGCFSFPRTVSPGVSELDTLAPRVMCL